jgi:MFS family permease
MNRNERWTVFLLGSAHTMVHFYEQIFPPLMSVMVIQFQITNATGAMMMTFLAMAFGFGALPAGYIADRIGPKRIVMVYLVGAAVSCVLIAFARSPVTLALGLTAMGAFISLYHPAGTTLVTTQVKQVGKALGYHGMGGGFGVVVAPALASMLAVVSPRYGWRLSFVVFGLLGLLVAAGVGTLKITGTPKTDTRARFWPEHLVAPGAVKAFILYLIAAVTVGFCYRGVMTFLPTYFSQELSGSLFAGSDLVKGGNFTTIALLVGIVGQFVGGQLTARHRLENLYATLLVITVPLLVLMGLFSNYMLFFVTILFAFFHFSGQPVGNSLVAKYTDARGRGLGFGLYFTATFGIGSLGAWLSGIMTQKFGINTVFFLLAAVVTFGFLVMLYLARSSDTAPDTEVDD